MTDLRDAPEVVDAFDELLVVGRKFSDIQNDIKSAFAPSYSKDQAERKFSNNLFDVIVTTVPIRKDLTQVMQKAKVQPLTLDHGLFDNAANHPVISTLKFYKDPHAVLANESMVEILVGLVELPDTNPTSVQYQKDGADFYADRIMDLANKHNNPEFVKVLEGFKIANKEVLEKYQAFAVTAKSKLGPSTDKK